MDTYLFNLVEQVESRRSVELFLEIGDCYCYGRHTDVNVENALYYYMQAANMGSSRGEFRVGMIYSKGIGIPKNVRLAEKYLKGAAKKGELDAVYLLGQMHWDGDIGFGKGRAFELWLKAARQHHPKSQVKVGYCYIVGIGEEKDVRKATFWLACAYLQSKKDKKASENAKEYLDWLISNRLVTSEYVKSTLVSVRYDHPEYVG